MEGFKTPDIQVCLCLEGRQQPLKREKDLGDQTLHYNAMQKVVSFALALQKLKRWQQERPTWTTVEAPDSRASQVGGSTLCQIS